MLVALRVPASAERTFATFTGEIGQWWKPNPLFAFDSERAGTLAFEGGVDGRLVERYDDGTSFTIGRILVWEPPHRFAVTWRQASFAPDQSTELHVRFEPVADDATRVVVEHFGWDTIPAAHAARHGFPLGAFQQRFGEWWQDLLDRLAETIEA